MNNKRVGQGERMLLCDRQKSFDSKAKTAILCIQKPFHACSESVLITSNAMIIINIPSTYRMLKIDM